MPDPTRTPMDLDLWLLHATDGLTLESTNRVRAEITAHYEDALTAAREAGQNAPEAQREAIAALGDPKIACKRFRRAYLWDEDEVLIAELNKSYRIPKQMIRSVLPLIGLAIAFAVLFWFFKLDGAFPTILFCFISGFYETYTALRSYYFRIALQSECERPFKRAIILFSIVAIATCSIVVFALFQQGMHRFAHGMGSAIIVTNIIIQGVLISTAILSIKHEFSIYLSLMRKLIIKAKESPKANQEGPDQYA